MPSLRVAPFLAIALGGAASAQTTRLVPSQYPTIQAAIDATNGGDTVLVDPGTYSETIDFLGKAIAVRSGAGPESTILQWSGGPAVPVVRIGTGEPATAVLEGFTVRFGIAGGVLVENGAAPLIVGNVVRQNTDCLSGAGIEVFSAFPRIVGNRIVENFQPNWCWGGAGGGIAVRGASGGTEIVGNLLAANEACSGGGIFVASTSGFVLVEGNRIEGNATSDICASAGGGIHAIGVYRIVQNLVVGNHAPMAGGGMHLELSPGGVVANNTVALNDAPVGAALYAPNGLTVAATIANNVFVSGTGQAAVATPAWNPFFFAYRNNLAWSEGGPAYEGGIPDPSGSWGNLSADPLLASAITGDFHLRPESPCVDAGFAGAPFLPAEDPDGDARVYDGDASGAAQVDIGYDEFSPIRRLGAGCAGSGGFVPEAGVSGPPPSVGNASFAVTIDGALGGSVGLLLFGALPYLVPIDLGFLGLPSCSLTIFLPAVLVVVPIQGTGPGDGTAAVPIPIPPDTSLQGAHVYFQWYASDPGPALFPGVVTGGLDVLVL